MNKITAALIVLLVAGCAFLLDDTIHEPNYDHVIGRKFSDSIYMGRESFHNVREVDGATELEMRRPDGCILVFGVRKVDDVILYWRVDSGPGTCLSRRRQIGV